MYKDAIFVAGNSAGLQRSELVRLFNDPNIREEGRFKIRITPTGPMFNDRLREFDIPKWVAWNIGSWLAVRGISVTVGITRFTFPTPSGVFYDMNIVLNNRGVMENYRVLIRSSEFSVRIKIITLTETSGGNEETIGPFGTISLVQWSSDAMLR